MSTQYVVIEGKDLLTRLRHQLMGLSVTYYEEGSYLELAMQSLIRERETGVPAEVSIQEYYNVVDMEEANDMQILINANIQLCRGLRLRLNEHCLYNDGRLSYLYDRKLGDDIVLKKIHAQAPQIL